MKYFVKKHSCSKKQHSKPNTKHTQPNKQASKKIISSISDKELVRLKHLQESVKKLFNLTKEEHEQLALDIAEIESLEEKFVIDSIKDFTSDIFINDTESFVRVITNKDILSPDDISDFINKIIDVEPESSALYTPAIIDPYYQQFGIPFCFIYSGLEIVETTTAGRV